MHPYHIKESTDERVATRLRAAERRQLIAEARASQAGDDPSDLGPRPGRGFRIPFLKWEVRMQPVSTARAGR